LLSKTTHPLITTLSNTKLAVTINHKGAELTSLRANNTSREYIWEGNPEYWGKHSPILFPIVGTLKDNSFTYSNKKYQLPRHGFARDMIFDLISKTQSEAIFSLQANEYTKSIYPFNFELQVIYILKDSDLVIKYKVFNKHSETMYYSIGGHPAFALPRSFEDYSLGFESNENLISYELENDLLSDKTAQITFDGNQLKLNYSLFEKDALIFKELKSKQIQLLEKNVPVLNFRFNDFPHFGIWTKMSAPFICLEPWVGYSDVIGTCGNIKEKEGIQKLEGNTAKEYSFSIGIL
jgi:galactose mutarotase-like enzyme